MKSKFNLCFYNLFSDKQLIKLSIFVNTIKYDQLYTPAKRHHIYTTDSLYEKIWLVLKAIYFSCPLLEGWNNNCARKLVNRIVT